jgi:hypothetical protein
MAFEPFVVKNRVSGPVPRYIPVFVSEEKVKLGAALVPFPEKTAMVGVE